MEEQNIEIEKNIDKEKNQGDNSETKKNIEAKTNNEGNTETKKKQGDNIEKEKDDDESPPPYSEKGGNKINPAQFHPAALS